MSSHGITGIDNLSRAIFNQVDPYHDQGVQTHAAIPGIFARYPADLKRKRVLQTTRRWWLKLSGVGCPSSVLLILVITPNTAGTLAFLCTSITTTAGRLNSCRNVLQGGRERRSCAAAASEITLRTARRYRRAWA